MVGTICSVFLPTNTVYLVRFDDLPLPEIASDEMLERVREARENEGTRAAKQLKPDI